MQKIRDALGNVADIITKVTHDGKEHVIIKKPYKDFFQQEEEDEKKAEMLVREDTERERLIREDIASKCITDWRDLFNDKKKQES